MEGMIIKRGDMFSAVFDGVNSEQSGLRPFVVLQNNIGNKYSPTLIVALITTKKKNTMPTHIELSKQLGLKEDSIAMLEQIRTIDKSRIIDGSYIGRVDRDTMKKIDEATKISFALENQRDLEARKQVAECEYWERSVNELIDDIYASNEQIRQRVIKLKIEHNKLKNICAKLRLYLNDYYEFDEVKYESLLRCKELRAVRAL